MKMILATALMLVVPALVSAKGLQGECRDLSIKAELPEQLLPEKSYPVPIQVRLKGDYSVVDNQTPVKLKISLKERLYGILYLNPVSTVTHTTAGKLANGEVIRLYIKGSTDPMTRLKKPHHQYRVEVELSWPELDEFWNSVTCKTNDGWMKNDFADAGKGKWGW